MKKETTGEFIRDVCRVGTPFPKSLMMQRLNDLISQAEKNRDARLMKCIPSEAHESDGWENAKKQTCCPGDDWADGYNTCRIQIIHDIKSLDK